MIGLRAVSGSGDFRSLSLTRERALGRKTASAGQSFLSLEVFDVFQKWL